MLHRSGCSATGVSFIPQTGGAALVGSRCHQPLSTHIAFTWKQGRSLGAALPKEARGAESDKREMPLSLAAPPGMVDAGSAVKRGHGELAAALTVWPPTVCI